MLCLMAVNQPERTFPDMGVSQATFEA